MTSSHRFCLLLTEEERQRLAELAKQERLSSAATLRRLIAGLTVVKPLVPDAQGNGGVALQPNVEEGQCRRP